MRLQSRHRPVNTKQSKRQLNTESRLITRCSLFLCGVLPCSITVLLSLWFDLHRNNYWVIFTVVTLNICSVTVLQYLTVLSDGYSRKDAPHPLLRPPAAFRLYALSTLERWNGFYTSRSRMVGLFACAFVWARKTLKRFNQEDSSATARSASELKRIIQTF